MGDWYSADLKPDSLHGLQGYKIFVAISMILDDGLYNFFRPSATPTVVASLTGHLHPLMVSWPYSPSVHGQELRMVAFLAGLAACGVMLSIVQTAAELMQDFKTGYLTLASPRSMFVSQEFGTAMGCVFSPCVIWLLYKAFDGIGTPGSEYPAPYALIYRNMAVLAIEGFSILPKNGLTLCYVGSVLINLARDILRRKVATFLPIPSEIAKMAGFIPLPMAMATPFFIGPSFAIDMCLGSFILFVWQKTNKEMADAFVPAVASGLICGDGFWTLPASVLALAKFQEVMSVGWVGKDVVQGPTEVHVRGRRIVIETSHACQA
ncbi:hypothetical protein ACLOJK_039064 [Asimina triloba]